MWYKTNSGVVYYIQENETESIVWLVWDDGLALQTRLDAEVVCNTCDRIDMPKYGLIALREMDKNIIHAYQMKAGKLPAICVQWYRKLMILPLF